MWLAAGSTRLRPIWVPVLVASPYAWLYARQLWDNTWLIPIGALAAAGHLSWCRSAAPWKAWLVVLLLALGVLIHPMIAPLAIAILLHAWVFERSVLRQQRRTLLLQALVVLLVAAPWLSRLGREPVSALAALSIDVGAPRMSPPAMERPSAATRWAFALAGGRVLSADGLEYFLGEDWRERVPGSRPWVFLSWLSYVLVWAGIGVAILEVRRRPGDDPGLAAAGRADDFHLAWLCLVTLALSWLMQGVLKRHTHPHYYNGVWICYAGFWWLAVTRLGRGAWQRRVLSAVGAAVGVALLVVTASMAARLHRDGGNRGVHFGTALASQLEAAATLSRYSPDSELQIEVQNLLMFPHALPVLRALSGHPGDPAGPRRKLRLGFRDPAPASAFFAVVEVAEPGATR